MKNKAICQVYVVTSQCNAVCKFFCAKQLNGRLCLSKIYGLSIASCILIVTVFKIFFLLCSVDTTCFLCNFPILTYEIDIASWHSVQCLTSAKLFAFSLLLEKKHNMLFKNESSNVCFLQRAVFDNKSNLNEIAQ